MDTKICLVQNQSKNLYESPYIQAIDHFHFYITFFLQYSYNQLVSHLVLQNLKAKKKKK